VLNTGDYKKYFKMIDETLPFSFNGRLKQVVGLCIEAEGPSVSVGDLCYIETKDTKRFLEAEVVGFKNDHVFLMPLGNMRGLRPGARIFSNHKPLSIKVGPELLGRVLDGIGNPIDKKGPLVLNQRYSTIAEPPSPLERERIKEPISTGVRAIDSLLTIGKGQRMGIFSGSGVGKSTLLGMIARYTNADVSVIGLVGERGREVREFIEKDLGEEGLKKSVVIVETGDKPPLMRLSAAYTATAVAEYFRDQGKDVILMIDSVTRIAMAQRDVGLAIGEPPAAKGYTPSVFSLLPKILERSGTSTRGSITGFYSVLVEADDFNEPISDACRSVLDGHIILSRDLAAMGHYPSIDVLSSISRVMPDIVDDDHQKTAGKIRKILASYKDAEDLINIGAYVKGTSKSVDFAISKMGKVNEFLQQNLAEPSHFQESLKAMVPLVSPESDDSEKETKESGIAYGSEEKNDA